MVRWMATLDGVSGAAGRFSRPNSCCPGRTRIDLAVRRALETAGVIFVDENGEGPGVGLRKPSKETSRKVGALKVKPL